MAFLYVSASLMFKIARSACHKTKAVVIRHRQIITLQRLVRELPPKERLILDKFENGTTARLPIDDGYVLSLANKNILIPVEIKDIAFDQATLRLFTINPLIQGKDVKQSDRQVGNPT